MIVAAPLVQPPHRRAPSRVIAAALASLCASVAVNVGVAATPSATTPSVVPPALAAAAGVASANATPANVIPANAASANTTPANAAPANAAPAAGLPPLGAALREALTRAGLIGRAVDPVQAFSWTLESSRPARPPRWQRERFAGTPPGLAAGLSPIWREYLPGNPQEAAPGSPGAGSAPPAPAAASGPADGYSVRGLMIVHPDDSELPVQVEGLSLPLTEGARFRLDYNEDGASLSQTCTVGASGPAASLYPALPGETRTIACAGQGSYRGIPVRGGATVAYLPRLGVFLNVEQHIDSPLGRLRWATRIVNFEMARP